MSATTNGKQLFRRYVNEVMNKGKYEVADEVFAKTYVEHDPFNPPDMGKGPESVKALVKSYRDAFPDAKMTIDELIETGDRVIARWSATGTHKGELMGIKPTNKKLRTSGITINRIRNGKIIEAWSNWDALGMLMQMGVVSPPQPKPRKKKAA